jgi:hypothetical protein
MPGTRGALTVRVADGHTDRHVTRHVQGLRFTKVAPGGHQSCSFTMNLPRDTFTDLGPQDRCWIYDARTARPVFDGYLENPTPVDGPRGQSFDVSAVGGMALANDETRALIYVDRDLAGWEKASDSAPSANVETGDFDGVGTGVRVQFVPGQPVGTGSLANVGYYPILRAGMTIGAIKCSFDSGNATAGYVQDFVTDSGSTLTGVRSTSAFPFEAYTDDDFTDGATIIGIRLRRSGLPTNVADDDTWTAVVDLSVVGQRMDRYGDLLLGAAGLVSADSVLAHHVVEDLLGRLLTFCDPSTALIEATTWEIDQLAFPNGEKAATVLGALDLWEPDMLWEIGAAGPNGLHQFNYRAWPTEARYEVSVKDGWRQTGGDVDLCNRILVSWTDANDKTQTTTVTADDLGLVGIGLPVDALGTRVKDADPITLPDGFGSEANAIRIGGEILRDKIQPPKAGTAVVRRPITDRLTGCQVMPWELEPGYVVRVRETGDELRCTQVEYTDDDVASTLTLGRPQLTEQQRVARLDAA